MKILSIEFTANYIYLYEQKVGGRNVTVEKKYRLDMPPNAYYNRMLVNNDRSISDVIKNCVAENRITGRKVVLAIPNTDCMVEEFSVLDGKRKELDGMVEQELRKRHKLSADYLYDYVILGPDPVKDGFLKIQVTLCVKAMVRNAYDVIKKAGLTPYKIVFINHAMEELAQRYGLTDAPESSLIACINQDEAHFLYVGHKEEPYYRYSKLKSSQKAEENLFVLSSFDNRTEETDYDDVIRHKVTEDLTRLVRFHLQRYPNKELAGIYLYGSYERLPELAEYLGDTMNSPVELYELPQTGGNVRYAIKEEEYAYNGVAAALSLINGKGVQYDFFAKLEEARAGERDKLLLTPSIVAAALLILVLLVTLFNKYTTASVLRQTEELTARLSGEELQKQYIEKNSMIEECGAYTAYNNQVNAAIELLETMPRFESDVFRTVDEIRPDGIRITGYAFKEGQLSLGCFAADQYAPAEFAKILQESGAYREVGYSGFQKNTDPLGEETYSFTINIKLW